MRVLLTLLLICANAEARVFDFSLNKFATYFKGNYGLTAVGKDAYKDSSGATTVFSNGPGFNWGGEVGVLIQTNNAGIRLGYELINPQKQSGIPGTSSGTEIVTLDSNILGAFPSAHFELYLSNNSKTSRFILSAGGGYGTVSLKNVYSQSPVGPFVEKGTATTYMLEGAAGFEFLFTDNITIVADAGYRYIPQTNFKADNTFTDVYGNTITKGDVLVNGDGTARQLDLGGVWAGLAFRFYINL